MYFNENILQECPINWTLSCAFRIWHLQIAELLYCAIVVYFAIMMLSFAIVVNKRTRGRNHRRIEKGCIMGGRTTAGLVINVLFIFCLF